MVFLHAELLLIECYGRPMKRISVLIVLLISTAACQALAAPTPTATPTITASPTSTATPTPVPPTPTPTVTPSPTATSTATSTPTITPTPSITPQPTVGFVFDNWQRITVEGNIIQSLQTPLIAFVNQNDRDGIGDRRTPQPATGLQTLYFVPPTNSAGRVAVLQLPSTTGNQIFISRNGRALAYFLQDPENQRTGLYVLDLNNRISGRILPVTSLVQRGFVNKPAWSPDGQRLAIALATGYDIDIFTIGTDGSNLQNITRAGSYDFWPAWSPDGRYLSFVSDRAVCPSWIPGDAEACDALTTAPPTGGNLYLLDLTSGEIRQLSDVWITEPPRWLNESQIVFSSGDPALGDPERRLFIASTTTMQSREVKLADGSDTPIRLSESWSPDGTAVVYQSAGTSTTEIIAARIDGTLIGRTSELTFARFGMRAAWAVDGSRIAIGGVNGQCPYGARVLNREMNFITRGSPPPSMCDPTYSPNGQWLAFTGVNPQIDGRVDIYVANPNGTGAVNLTGSLRGSILLLGWFGGS